MAKSEAKHAGKPPTHASDDAPPDPLKWVREHRRVVSAVGIALLAVAGGAWLTITTQERKEAAGQEAMNGARAAFDAYNLPTAAAAFQDVIQNYSGTRAAKEASIALNQVRLVNGQNELAIVSLRDFIAGNPGQVYQVPASALVGSALENVNRPSEAADAFLAAASGARVDYMKAEYLLAAGRALTAAGRTEEAEQAFRTITDEYAATPSVSEATVRLSELVKGGYSDGPEGL
jgi:outer membrane protein assembly factor BamD (BamD/ComL family)